MKNQLAVLIAQMNESGILYAEAVREFKKVFITHVLQQHNGNQCKASRQLGMHRNTLSRTISELGLDVKDIRKLNGQAAPAQSSKEMRRPPRSAQSVPMEKKAAR